MKDVTITERHTKWLKKHVKKWANVINIFQKSNMPMQLKAKIDRWQPTSTPKIYINIQHTYNAIKIQNTIQHIHPAFWCG